MWWGRSARAAIHSRAAGCCPLCRPGARVALLDAGAYGAVMSSSYNARPELPIAMVDGDRWAVIRARQPHERLWEGETIPDFLPAISRIPVS